MQLFVISLLSGGVAAAAAAGVGGGGGGGGGSAPRASDCKSYDEKSKGPGKSPSSDRRVVCSNMELHQVLPPDSFPNRTVTL